MNPIYGYMYTRPGNLWKEFDIVKKVSKNQQGYLKDGYEKTGRTLKGVLSVAENQTAERTKNLWDQDQHSLTHVLALRGRALVKKGDFLANGEKMYLVLTTDMEGMSGASSILYLEERNDLK